MMLNCSQARLLLQSGAVPGTPRKGFPELGFHLATCTTCRITWKQICGAADNIASSNGSQQGVTIATDSQQDELPTINLDEQLVNNGSSPPTESRAERNLHSVVEDAEHVSELLAVQFGQVPSQPVTYRSLLQNRNYRLLWLGQGVSTFGSYFTRIAVPIYVYNVTGVYAHLGFAVFTSLVPSLLFGLFAGAVVDRWDRRRCMIYVDLANMLVMLSLVFFTSLQTTTTMQLSAIYFVNFLAGMLRELFNPARVAIFPDVLAEHELLTANSLDSATTTLAEFLSYPVAAVVLFYMGPALAFGIDGFTFLLSALLIWQVKVPAIPLRPAPSSNIWVEISDGLKIVQRVQPVRKIVILSLIVPLFLSLHNVLLIPFVEESLASSKEVGFPVLESASALGLVIGMLALGRWGQHVPRAQLLAYGIGGYGVATFLQAFLPQLLRYTNLVGATNGSLTPLLILVLPFALFCGAANSLIVASIRTVMQEQTPREALGRVYSVMTAAAGGGFAIGALFTGFAQGQAGTAIIVLGIILCVSGIICSWWLPEKEARMVLLDSPV